MKKNIIRYIFFLMLLLGQNIFLEAQTSRATISGYVTDEVSGDAIQGARVIVEGYTEKYTNENGYYYMAVPSGFYHIRCIAFGYYNYLFESFNINGTTQFNISLTPQECAPPVNLSGKPWNYDHALLTWNSSNANIEEWIHYDDEINFTNVGLSEGGTFDVAIRFTPGQLSHYVGSYLSWIKFYPTSYNVDFSVKVWKGNNAEFLISEQFVPFPLINQWNSILLDSLIPIDHNMELWIGYSCKNIPPNNYPAGCDDGPSITGFGDMIYIEGTGWFPLSTYDLDYNWNLQGYIQSESEQLSIIKSPEPEIELLGYNIYRNEEKINQDPVINTFYQDGPLPSPFDYTFYVTAVYPDCESEPSNSIVVLIENISELKPTEIEIYPVPVSGSFTIKSDKLIKSIRIFDVSGNLISEERLNKNIFYVDASQWSSNFLFIEIETTTGKVFRTIIVSN